MVFNDPYNAFYVGLYHGVIDLNVKDWKVHNMKQTKIDNNAKIKEVNIKDEKAEKEKEQLERLRLQHAKSRKKGIFEMMLKI